MNVTISTAPGMWGVEHASDPGNPLWTDILDEAAEQDRLLHDPAARADAEASIDHLRRVGIAQAPPVAGGVA